MAAPSIIDVKAIVDEVLLREGPGRPPYQHAPGGDRRSWGISDRLHPVAWRNGPPPMQIAREIIKNQYVWPFAEALERLGSPDALIAQLVDDAVCNGVSTAIKRLQVVLGVDVLGFFDERTVLAVGRWPVIALQEALVRERVIRLCRRTVLTGELELVTARAMRALSFLPSVRLRGAR